MHYYFLYIYKTDFNRINMFEEEDDDFFDASLNEDIARFEEYLSGGSMGFVDSDRLEMLIDHYLMNSQYSKANLAADYTEFSIFL